MPIFVPSLLILLNPSPIMRLSKILSGWKQWMQKLLLWNQIIPGLLLLYLFIRRQWVVSGSTGWSIGQMAVLKGTSNVWLLKVSPNKRVLILMRLFHLLPKWPQSKPCLLFLLLEVGIWLNLMSIMLPPWWSSIGCIYAASTRFSLQEGIGL